MLPLKKLTAAGVERALRKAERYRLLNEPWEAESICRDVLEVDDGNREATIGLILALSDQFPSSAMTEFEEARTMVERLGSEYERAYYRGILYERRARAIFARGAPHSGASAHGWLAKAMEWFESAERLAPAGNEDATLRWNTCARMLEKHPSISPVEDDSSETMLE
jgi:hypothetical protein